MNKFKISTRLYALVALMAMLVLGIGGLGFYASHSSNDSLRTVYEDRTVPMEQLSTVNQLLNRNQALLQGALLNGFSSGERVDRERAEREMRANTQKMQVVWAAYMATYLTPEESRLATQWQQQFQVLQRDHLDASMKAVVDDDVFKAVNIYNSEVLTRMPPVQATFDQLMALQVDVARQLYEQAVARFQRVRTWSLMCILVGLALSLGLCVMLVRGIASGLALATRLSQAVADGDLSVRIEVRGQDELAHMLHTLQAMQERLAGTVSRVRQGADAVALASSDIAQGDIDLSARTESQASSLEQTAASMEELSSTVRQNADNAEQANALARRASEVAEAGGQAVAEVVHTMRGISESSAHIADIINVIDGIAFQTNILALNAAVEAARAGEQGRGFAVVAGEVRHLAQRSAQAAKEIKALITQSVDRVSQGRAQVDRAGHTMEQVVSGIRRVTDLVSEITVASHEQSSGVQQVGEAVQNMDQVTQQNAALVEQMAAAASSLRQQAQDLVQAVAFFKLRDAQDLGTRVVPDTPAREAQQAGVF